MTMGRRPRPLSSFYDVQPNGGCWVWKGDKDSDGYGRISRDYKRWLAHRYVWRAHRGPIPEGALMDHLCRNHACVNPAHLRVVDARTNTIENSVNFCAENVKKTQCPKGHDYASARVYRGRRFCRTCDRDRRRTERANG